MCAAGEIAQDLAGFGQTQRAAEFGERRAKAAHVAEQIGRLRQAAEHIQWIGCGGANVTRERQGDRRDHSGLARLKQLVRSRGASPGDSLLHCHPQ